MSDPISVTYDTNFCRVFELPSTEFPKGFLFGGGKPVPCIMVDWFNPICDDLSGPLKPWDEYVPMLKQFLSDKCYIRPGHRYVLITDFREALVFEKK